MALATTRVGSSVSESVHGCSERPDRYKQGLGCTRFRAALRRCAHVLAIDLSFQTPRVGAVGRAQLLPNGMVGNGGY